jgi:pyruvate ferredoxin oxidoreductase alpha subunit
VTTSDTGVQLLEGSQAVAQAISRARPGVVCAYPISPQTHIVEALSAAVRKGTLPHCEYINVESEFAAMSVAIGSSAAGARTYTATASQGLLYMAEAVYNAAGLGLPIVMTVASRAIGSPINIWNDHSDSLSQRDSGWLQLFAADNQEAVDLHIQAFAIAEELRLPVMVCMDGFVLTHALELVDIPSQDAVDAFLPPASDIHAEMDVATPGTVGTMAGPDIFTETKYVSYQQHVAAHDVVEKWGQRWFDTFGRDAGGLVRLYETSDDGVVGGTKVPAASGKVRGCDPNEIVVIAMGSTLGTMQAVLPELADEGIRVRLVGITSFRPFPDALLREVIGQARRVVVIDRAVQLGIGGVLTGEIRRALYDSGASVHPVAAGLGGRPITEKSLAELVRQASRGELDVHLNWMDLRHDVVDAAVEASARATAEGVGSAAAAMAEGDSGRPVQRAERVTVETPADDSGRPGQRAQRATVETPADDSGRLSQRAERATVETPANQETEK